MKAARILIFGAPSVITGDDLPEPKSASGTFKAHLVRASQFACTPPRASAPLLWRPDSGSLQWDTPLLKVLNGIKLGA